MAAKLGRSRAARLGASVHDTDGPNRGFSDFNELEQERIEHELTCAEMDKKIRSVESAFKERYSFLKRVYEERLDSILNQIRVANSSLTTDPMLNQIISSAETFQFAGARVQEIVIDSLAQEREKYIVQLAEDLAEAIAQRDQLEADYELLNKRVEDHQPYNNRRIEKLNHELGEKQVQLEKLKDANQQLKESNRKAEKAIEHRKHSSSKEREIIARATTRLVAIVVSQNTLLASQKHSSTNTTTGSSSLEKCSLTELLDRVEGLLNEKETWMNEQMSMMKTQTFQESETSYREKSAALQDLGDLDEQNRVLEQHIEFLQQECQQLRNGLEVSEHDREQVKAKYFELGNELKEALQKQQTQVVEQQDSTRNVEVKLNQALRDNLLLETQLKQSQQQVQRLERKINKLKEGSTTISTKKVMTDSEEDESSTVKLLLSEQSKLYEAKIHPLETQIESLNQKYAKQKEKHRTTVEKLEAKHRESIQEMQTKLRKLEQSKHDEIRAIEKKLSKMETKAMEDSKIAQEKLHNQFTKLSQSKAQELKALEKEHQIEIERKFRELQTASQQNSPAHEIAASHIATLLKDHISVTQHEQVMHARLGSLRSDLNQQNEEHKRQLEERHQRELRDALGKKDQEFAMSMVNIREGIKKLENQLEVERRDKKLAEEQLVEERRVVNEFREKAIDEEQGKRKLLVHLEEANSNILRLKSIVQQVSGRAEQLEHNQKLLDSSKQNAEQKLLDATRKIQDLETKLTTIETQSNKIQSENVSQTKDWTAVATELATTKYALGQVNEERDRLLELLKAADKVREDAVRMANSEKDDKSGLLSQELHAKYEREAEKLADCKAQIVSLQVEIRETRLKAEEIAKQRESLAVEYGSVKSELNASLRNVEHLTKLLEEKDVLLLKLNENLEVEKRKSSETINEAKSSLQHKGEQVRLLQQQVKKHQLQSSRSKVRMLNQVASLVRPLEQDFVKLSSATQSELDAFQSDLKRIVTELSFKYRDAVSHVRNQSNRERTDILEHEKAKFEVEKVRMRETHETELNEMQEKFESQLRAFELQRVEDGEQYQQSLHEAIEMKEEQFNSKLESEREKWDAIQQKTQEAYEELKQRYADLSALNDDKESILAEKLNELRDSQHLATQRLQELEQLEGSLKQSQLDVEKLEGKVKNLQDELVVQTKSSTDYAREADTRSGNQMAVAVALSSEIPISQDVLDGLNSTDAVTFNRYVKKLHSDIRSHLSSLNNEAQNILSSKLKEVKESLESQIKEKQVRIESLSEENQHLKELERSHSEQVSELQFQLQSKVDEVDRLDEELKEYMMELEAVSNERDEITNLGRMEVESKERTFQSRLDEVKEDLENEKQNLIRKHRSELQASQVQHETKIRQVKADADDMLKAMESQVSEDRKRLAETEQELWRLKQEFESSIANEKSKSEKAEHEASQYRKQVEMLENSRSMRSPRKIGSPSSMTSSGSAFFADDTRSMRRGSTSRSIGSLEEFKGVDASPSNRRRRRSSLRRLPSMKLDVDDLHLNIHQNGEVDMTKDDGSLDS